MPRYHFNVHDGQNIPDDEGAEHPDLAAARREALRYACHLLSDGSEAFWDGQDWSMDVTDDRGLILFSLRFVGTDAPSVSARFG